MGKDHIPVLATDVEVAQHVRLRYPREAGDPVESASLQSQILPIFLALTIGSLLQFPSTKARLNSPTPSNQTPNSPSSASSAAGAKVPLRSAAFRPTALPALPCRLLPSPLQPCPLHSPGPLRLPGLLLSGLLHGPHHLLVSLLSVELPHLLHPLLRRRALEPVPVSATVTVIHCEGVPPRRLTRPPLCPFHPAR